MSNFFDMFKNKKNNRKIIPVFFIIDASGSMKGPRISHINKSIKTMINKFADFNRDETNEHDIKIAILTFSTGSNWMNEGLTYPDEFCFKSISCGGVTDLGSALETLNEKLSKKEFFAENDCFTTPIIYFITDGAPTDNYVSPLIKLNANRWYKIAKKYAISIGDSVDYNALKNVVGNSNSIIHINSDALLDIALTGLCSSFLVSSITVTTAVQPSVPPMINSEFDSDYACTSVMNSQTYEFDSDHFGETCALNDAENKFNDKDTIAGLSEQMPNLKRRFGKISACYGYVDLNSLSDEAKERRKKLAEALRNGEPIEVDFTEEIRNPYIDGIQNGIHVPDGKLAGGGTICPSCGNVIMIEHNYCPKCGMPVRCAVSHIVDVHQVQFSAIVPKQFIKGEYSMIDITVYEEMYRNVVDRIIANTDDNVKEIISGSKEIADNTIICIELFSPDIDLMNCEETQKWQGRFLTFSFPIEVPKNYAKKQVLFMATVYFNGVIATKLKFIANCTSVKEQKIQLAREDVLTAFISYASQDRSRVATIIQGMKKARPDMDIFFDVESLRSGEDWENILRREIEKRDVLFLCWSNFARNSEWVEKEWRYALINKGIDAIEPVPLVSPVDCPPPDELKSKHFNDRALLYKE